MFEFSLDDHPARVKVAGNLVPAINDVKSVRVKDEDDGKFYLAGYVSIATKNVSLIRPYPQIFVDAVAAFVEHELGDCGTVNRASKLEKEPQDHDDWNED